MQNCEGKEGVRTLIETMLQADLILAEQFGVPLQQVLPGASLVTDFNADSLDIPELVISLEEMLGTEINQEEAWEMKTVADVHALVGRYMRRAAAT